MSLTRRGLSPFAAVLAAGVAAAALMLLPTTAQAATTSLCNSATASVAGGAYHLQNNEYDSSASECITTDGNADFTVANSSIANATNGSPGAYPSIFAGCHWGNCSTGGLSSNPIQVSALTSGEVTTSWSTTQPGGSSNAYDVAYDIWFNQSATTSGQPNCTEMMVWLNHDGSVQPFGSEVASNVSVGGASYNVWEGGQSSWDTVSYTMTSAATSVSNLDLYPLAQDAVSRGYLSKSCYLIDIEAGFELWQGGAGLATNSFSVNSPGSSGGSSSPSASASVRPSASASASASASSSPTATSTSTGSGTCTASYSITSSWSGGYQAQVTVTAGSSPITAWKVGWTFPNSQTISSLWSGSYTQSGNSVTVNNASYDGSLAAHASTSFGFTATDTGSDAAPSSLTCTG
jgi:cellulose 1,4-beta-cellobiosidase